MNDNTAATTDNRRWTIIKLIRWATSYLKSYDIDSPRATGEILLAHALQLNRIDLYLKYDQPLVADELQTFKKLIQRRVRREPVAYILGVKEFWSLDLEINSDVLIPRPETECLVEVALDLLARKSSRPPQRILDLGTGSGAIVLALASQQSRHSYFASDRFPPAVKLAFKNAGRHDLCQKIHFFVGDWLSSINSAKPGFDLIVSNPPYIPCCEIGGLQPEIHQYEPIAALNGDTDGLACYRKIIGAAHRHLNADGVLLLEIGHDQREGIRQIAADRDRYKGFSCSKDYSGYDRVVTMRKRE
ncbi:Peptide chain release factor N(5)-glutamine methyltransferase (EC [Olavius sp. associated proteobacterium Delta 1]|nr:Peptide chain release factor N(5)-glutamine methyltransferase (EC [Olavius sp. associated proteobacterium Delta 1]